MKKRLLPALFFLLLSAVFILIGIGLDDFGEIMSNGAILCLSCIGIG